MDAILKAIFKLRDAVDPWLRKIMFPKRNTRFASELDSRLKQIVGMYHPSSALLDGKDAELELETRDWLREFWSRSLVAWLALVISVVSITIAIATCSRQPRPARPKAVLESFLIARWP